jgi:drug/metabolite transporter (DMT)-like permease
MKNVISASQQNVSKREGILLALAAGALWGLTPVATKIALEGFSPEIIGVVRLAIAAVLFRLVAGRGTRWFVADPWIWLAGAGLAADFLLYNYGMQRTAANVAGLVINIELISTIVLAMYILGERLSSRRVAGAAITLTGVLVVTLDGVNLSDLTDVGRILGNILVMLAGIAWSVFAVAQRRAQFVGNLFQLLTPIFSVAALMTAPVLVRKEAWIVRGGVLATVMFIILTVFGTNAVYWIYARAQELIEVSVLSILLCTIPVFAVVFAYVLLHERLTLQLFIGGAIIVAGIVVIATERARIVDNSELRAGAAGQL